MADDTRDVLPQRAVESDDDSLAGTGLAAFRARVERFALPAVLALAVAAGLAFGGISPQNDASLSATPASSEIALVDRAADAASRSDERPEIGEENVVPDAAVVGESPETDAPAAPPAPAAPEVLNGVSFAPSASASSSPSASAAASTAMYATETVNVRSGSSASSERIGSVSQGDKVTATGRTENGFTQVTYQGRNGWITSQYLSKSAPAAGSSGSSTSAAPSGSAAPGGGRACAPLPGLTSRTAAVHQALCQGFPAVRSYGGVRPDWDAEHPSGRAIDAMVSSTATGDAVANWARANASRYGITEVIWNQRIWTTQRSGEGWRMMSDRGSATANHRDHVHISVR